MNLRYLLVLILTKSFFTHKIICRDIVMLVNCIGSTLSRTTLSLLQYSALSRGQRSIWLCTGNKHSTIALSQSTQWKYNYFREFVQVCKFIRSCEKGRLGMGLSKKFRNLKCWTKHQWIMQERAKHISLTSTLQKSDIFLLWIQYFAVETIQANVLTV